MKAIKSMLVLLLALTLLLSFSALASAEAGWESVLCEGQELNDVRNIVQTDTGFWVCTKGGLYFVSDAGQVQRMFVNELKTQFVYDIAIDKEGNAYVTQGFTYSGGENYGILKISADGEVLAHYTAENSGLADNFVQAVEVDAAGRIWAGSGKGISILDPATGEWFNAGRSVNSFNSVNTIVPDGQGNMWLGFYPDGQQGGLAGPFSGGYGRMDKEGNAVIVPYEGDEVHNSFLLGDFWTRGIAVDAEGGAWIIRSGAAPTYFNNPGYVDATGQPIDISKCVGGRLDYVKIDGTRADVQHYTGRELFTAIDKGIVATDFVNKVDGATPELRMVAIDGGGLWLGTSSAGLFRYAQGEAEIQYSSGNCEAFDNAFFDNIYALTMLDDGTLAVGSQGGLRLLKADAAAVKVHTPAPERTVLSKQAVSFNGEPVKCQVYNIDGNNYFKLRDLAFLLKDTENRFSVGYDEATQSVTAVAGEDYQAVGGELETGADESATCMVSRQSALFNGAPAQAYIYNIGGNNYFKLRDVAAAFGFTVEFDEETNTAHIISIAN